MKKVLLAVFTAVLLCGCGTPNRGAMAIAYGLNQGAQNMNQQQAIQNQQWNQQFMQMQQQQLQNKQDSGSAAYNPYTGTSQYVPPGWHKVWDSNSNTWIIQP